tara:strand:- start:547 stop:2247 length:1701 start_codon:yes stop_codon:yes gene_type:complete
LLLCAFGCAQVKPLTGGEKDTIPPNIIKSIPERFSTNTNSDYFFFEFDELVDASTLREKLIISPFYDGSFEVKTKKNTITIFFDSLFEDSTTYIFNFADGVTDVTERNPSLNSKFVFSTGGKIDSSYVSGVIHNPLKNELVEGALVGLYNKEDSLDLFHKKPVYFSLTDEGGRFRIENLKKDEYTIYAFFDENNNLQAEYKKELFGFLEESILIGDSIENLYIPIFNEDLTNLELLRKRERGSVVDLVYNKKIKEYKVSCVENISYGLSDNNLLSVYKNKVQKDSIFLKVSVKDVNNYIAEDSFYIKFGEEVNTNNETKSSFKLKSNNADDSIEFKLETNKPLIKYSIDNVEIKYDTVALPKKFYGYYTKKKSNNLIEGKMFIQVDSASKYIEKIKKDIIADSLDFENDSIYKSVSGYYKRLNTSKLSLEIKKGSIITIDNDSIKTIKEDLRIRGKDYYGGLSGSVVNIENNKNIIVELVNEKFTQIINNKMKGYSFDFQNIPPGKYYLRVIEDKNNNYEWDYYSIKKKIDSERITYYPELIEVLSNWTIEDLLFDVEESVEKMFE